MVLHIYSACYNRYYNANRVISQNWNVEIGLHASGLFLWGAVKYNCYNEIIQDLKSEIHADFAENCVD